MLVNNHFYVVHKDNALYKHKDSSDIIMAYNNISVFYRDTVPKEYTFHMTFGMWPKFREKNSEGKEHVKFLSKLNDFI